MTTSRDRSQGHSRPHTAAGALWRDRLHPSTLELLRDRLGLAGPEHSFAGAVTLQLLRSAIAHGGGSLEGEHRIAQRVAALVADPDGAEGVAALARDAEMLSSFFQNVDLLYAASSPRADAVALLVMRALEIVDRTD